MRSSKNARKIIVFLLVATMSGVFGLASVVADVLHIDFDAELADYQDEYHLYLAPGEIATFPAPLLAQQAGPDGLPATVSLDGPGSASWITSATSVSFANNEYGVWKNSTVTVTAPLVPGDASGTLAWSSSNNKLNTNPAKATVYLHVGEADKTPPTTEINLAGTVGNNGWYTSDVLVTLTASDTGSGVYKTEYGLGNEFTTTYTVPFYVTNEGTTTIVYRSIDNAGNVEATRTQEVKIDKTTPDIQINGVDDGAQYTLGQAPTPSYTATDGVSGIDSTDATLTGGNANGVGSYNYTVNATDKAGNTTTVVVHYQVVYPWSGFLQPINNDGSSVFTRKAGSTIPIKFKIMVDGSPYGLAEARLKYAKISDGIAGDAVEAISTSAATTGNWFRYDADKGQYIFNLSTKGLEAGTYLLKVELDDGTSHTVEVSLR